MPHQPSRRDVLKASVGVGVLGLSGCLSGSDDDSAATKTTGETTTASPTTDESRTTSKSTTTQPSDVTHSVGETFTANDGLTVTVEEVRHQYSTYYLDTPDTLDVLNPDRTQFLYASVRVSPPDRSSERPAKDAFRLVAENDEYPAESEINGVGTFHLRPDFKSASEYGTDSYRGWLVFAPPATLTKSNTAVTLQRGESQRVSWTLGSDLVERLVARPPTFSVEEFTPPESVLRGDPVSVPVTVSNAGGAGTFRSSFNSPTGSTTPVRFEFAVEADETKTQTATVRYPSDAEQVTYSFASGGLNREFTVEVAES
jgi:hypothetical protein